MNQETVQAYGDIAAGVMSYPIMPHLLEPHELEVIANSIHGFQFLGEQVDPALAEWSRVYGGGVIQATLKLKLQGWFRNWVQAPEHYVVHHPRVANGVWFRLYRTTMRSAAKVADITKDVATLSEQDVVARWEHVLGVGARSRKPDFKSWLADTLASIQLGDWHLAVYSPKWEAFISPVVDEPGSANLVERTLAEFPPIEINLYPGSNNSPSTWNLAEAVCQGAYIEVMGKVNPAPPFGNWGPGVMAQRHNAAPRTIAGVIHRRAGRVQAFPVTHSSAGEENHDFVVVDAPNLAGLLKDIYLVTGWRLGGLITAEAMQDETLLAEEVFRVSQGLQATVKIPTRIFLDAIQTNPNFTPVYGRLISVFDHVALSREGIGEMA